MMLAGRPASGQEYGYQWGISAGGPFAEGGDAIAVAPDGSLIVAGVFNGHTNIGGELRSAGRGDLFVAKLDVEGGEPLWKWSTRAGGVNSDYVVDLAVTEGGEVRLAGAFSAEATYGNDALTEEGAHFAVATLDDQGLWSWIAAGRGGHIRGMDTDDSGSTFVTVSFEDTVSAGPFTLPPSGRSITHFLGEIDAGGTWVSVRVLPYEALDVAVAAESSLVVASPDSLYRYSRSGELRWAVESPVGGETVSIEGYTNGGVVVSGEDAVARIDASGTTMWTAHGEGGDVNIDDAGHVYVIGTFTGRVTFGAITLRGMVDSTSDQPTPTPFVAMLSPLGRWMWAERGATLMGDSGVVIRPSTGWVDDIAPAPGGLYLTGHYRDRTQFGDDLLPVYGKGDVFVAHLDLRSDVDYEESEAPTHYRLGANYPDPFRASTTIQYEVIQPSQFRITVLDLLGRTVKVLLDEPKPKGIYSLQIDMTDLPSGTYFYRMEAGGAVETRKMVLVR